MSPSSRFFASFLLFLRRQSFVDLHNFFQKRLNSTVENGQQPLRLLSEHFRVNLRIGLSTFSVDDADAFVTLKRRPKTLLRIFQSRRLIRRVCKEERFGVETRRIDLLCNSKSASATSSINRRRYSSGLSCGENNFNAF